MGWRVMWLLPIVPYWNWNDIRWQEAYSGWDYQSYHTGIETLANMGWCWCTCYILPIVPYWNWNYVKFLDRLSGVYPHFPESYIQEENCKKGFTALFSEYLYPVSLELVDNSDYLGVYRPPIPGMLTPSNSLSKSDWTRWMPVSTICCFLRRSSRYMLILTGVDELFD